jgi:hypothetical protein
MIKRKILIIILKNKKKIRKANKNYFSFNIQ